MHTYTEADLERYMKNDWIHKLLIDNDKNDDTRYDEWLYQIEAKRMIYADVYGDLLTPGAKRKKVLDIGGGYRL